jgi:hypothetical protein
MARVVGLTILAVSCGIGCLFQPVDLSMHKVVEGITYGKDKALPPVDHELYLYALLKPTLVRKFSDCPKATQLIGKTPWTELVELGDKLNGATSSDKWAEIMTGWSSFGDPNLGKDPMVPLAVGEAAGQLSSYLRELRLDEAAAKDSRLEEPAPAERAAEVVLRRLVNQVCSAAPSVEAPSLALSGGSANGAFVAGFLYELLVGRELIWQSLKDGDKAKFLKSSQFSGVVGTSVGSLIGQLLDLYAVQKFYGSIPKGERDDKEKDVKALFDADKNALSLIVYEPKYSPPSHDRLNQVLEHIPHDEAELARQWALVKLFGHFTDIAEPEAICVQPGPASRAIVGYPLRHVPGLMRFDPLHRTVIEPLLNVAGSAMASNGFPRIAVSVEVSQNLTAGLDDTACQDLPASEVANCLGAGIMAASVLPFFAQPVNRVRTGLSQQEDCGIWLDGGLRSGFPLERALPLSRPSSSSEPKLRTLAISTHRATGLPSGKTEDTLLDIAKSAIEEMGDQIQMSEVFALSQFVVLQEQRWRALSVAMGLVASDAANAESHPPEKSLAIQSAPTGVQAQLEGNPYLEVVFVPRTVPDYFVAGAGYRFDPIVMRGLFASGQLEAIERAKQGLIARLGWEHADEVAQKLESDQETLKAWFKRVNDSWKSEAVARHDEGKRRFSERVESCPEAPTAAYPPPPEGPGEAPRYFGGASPTCRKLEAPK